MNRISSMVLVLVLTAATSVGHAQTINERVVSYLQQRVGQRIGGGECGHAVAEALRVAGAEFINSQIGPDSPAAGDYVWGTFMKSVSYSNNKWTDSSPGTRLLPGDVIQYRNATFVYPSTTPPGSGSTTVSAPHHTSIVAAVNSAGMPTFVYQQNFNNIRTLKKDAIDLTKLKSGYVRIYRGKARVNTVGKYKYSIVNNTAVSQTASVKLGTNTSVGSIGLTAVNTPVSYLNGWLSTTSSTSRFKIVLANGPSIEIANGAAYEIYTDSARKSAIRRLSP